MIKDAIMILAQAVSETAAAAVSALMDRIEDSFLPGLSEC